MPRVAFEPMIQEFELAKIFHALDRVATVIGTDLLNNSLKFEKLKFFKKFLLGQH
jgi:hypothetical protein